MKQIVLAASVVVLIALFVGVRVAVTASGEDAGDLDCRQLDDEYEDNDTEGTAYQVLAPVSLTTLYLCPGDDDLFRFEVTPGATMDIDAAFTQADGDVDIVLYSPHSSGYWNEVAASRGHTHGESIQYVDVPDANPFSAYLVRANLYEDFGEEGVSYTLSINTTTGTPGDVNDDDEVNAIDAALILQFGAGLANSLPNLPNADVSGDGSVNAVDAALVLQFTAGLIQGF